LLSFLQSVKSSDQSQNSKPAPAQSFKNQNSIQHFLQGAQNTEQNSLSSSPQNGKSYDQNSAQDFSRGGKSIEWNFKLNFSQSAKNPESSFSQNIKNSERNFPLSFLQSAKNSDQSQNSKPTSAQSFKNQNFAWDFSQNGGSAEPNSVQNLLQSSKNSDRNSKANSTQNQTEPVSPQELKNPEPCGVQQQELGFYAPKFAQNNKKSLAAKLENFKTAWLKDSSSNAANALNNLEYQNGKIRSVCELGASRKICKTVWLKNLKKINLSDVFKDLDDANLTAIFAKVKITPSENFTLSPSGITFFGGAAGGKSGEISLSLELIKEHLKQNFGLF